MTKMCKFLILLIDLGSRIYWPKNATKTLSLVFKILQDIVTYILKRFSISMQFRL
jgi:hypothetical protein